MTFYGVQTESGSWYLVEHEDKIFRNPVWKLIMKKGTFYIKGIMKFEENSVPANKITSPRQFVGSQIYFSDEKESELTITLPHTSLVKQIIEFK